MNLERFRSLPAAGIAAITLLGIAWALTGYAEEAKKEGAKGTGHECYKFVAPLEPIMEVMSDVFEAMPDKLKSGKYKDLKREALFVAEIANLTTHVPEHRENKDWQSLCEALKTSALKMAEAADKKDENGVKALHAKATESCDTCHEKIRDA
jgi:hypothetical protein